MSAVSPASRDPWLDNVKMVLVTLVVVGHAIGLVEATAGSAYRLADIAGNRSSPMTVIGT